jgi:hypothetical protein
MYMGVERCVYGGGGGTTEVGIQFNRATVQNGQ